MTRQRKVLLVVAAFTIFFLVRFAGKKAAGPEYPLERGGQQFKKFDATFNLIHYVEEDGNWRHLWKISCTKSGNRHLCSSQIITLAPDKCMILGAESLDWEPAKRTSDGGYIVETSPAGLCQYTHTFIFGEKEMTDTRMPTSKTPTGLGHPALECSKTPTVRKAQRHEHLVLKNPLKDCATLHILPD